jgi:osmotically-inducible protein OsmY
MTRRIHHGFPFSHRFHHQEGRRGRDQIRPVDPARRDDRRRREGRDRDAERRDQELYGLLLCREGGETRLGVKAVANEIQVKLSTERLDPEIAEDAVKSLKRELPSSAEKVKVVVKNGWLTLEGHVEWNFQKEWAERAVRSISGVKGVTNLITVEPRVNPGDVKKKIEDALVRSAQVDAQRVEVIADGGKVTLKGTVRSWAERQEAERSAWAAPGVTSVDNQIRILP